MTKGRAVLPGTVVAEQEPFFITLGGPAGPSFLGRKTFPRKSRQTAGPSTALRSGRDDKGEGLRLQEPFFITLGGPAGP